MPIKIPYTKKVLSFSEQLEQLKTRGLIVENKERAKHYLQHINYYRLSAYMYPFLEDKQNHKFKEGTTFQEVMMSMMNIKFSQYLSDNSQLTHK